MGGVPIIRNLRIPVATVVDMVADGMSDAEILQAYPDLEAPTSKRPSDSPLKPCESARSPCSQIGEVLIQNAISPDVAQFAAGHDAIHVRDGGMADAEDEHVMALVAAEE